MAPLLILNSDLFLENALEDIESPILFTCNESRLALILSHQIKCMCASNEAMHFNDGKVGCVVTNRG